MNLGQRTKFLLLLGVFALPVAAAYLAYFGWRPDTHGNYGELLPPAPLTATAGRTNAGQAYDLDQLKGRWIMVHVGPAACDARCANLLYLMRQTRIAQGKEQSRIARLWVVDDGGAPTARVLERHEDLVVWRPASPDFSAQFSAAGGRGAHIYLVDPLGNLMLRFPADPDAKKIMKDLKLLLKASQVG